MRIIRVSRAIRSRGLVHRALLIGLVMLAGPISAQVQLTEPKHSHFWPGSFTPRLWATSGDALIGVSVRGAHFWNLEDESIDRSFVPPHSGTPVLALSHTGDRLFTASPDGQVRIWNVATGELLEAIAGNSVAAAADADVIALITPEGFEVELRRALDGSLIERINLTEAPGMVPNARLRQVWLSPDGNHVAAQGIEFGVWNRTTQVFTLAPLKVVTSNGAIAEPIFSPDSNAMFTADQKVNLATGAAETLPLSESRYAAALSRDGTVVYLQRNSPVGLTLYDSSIRAVNLSTGEMIWEIDSLGFGPLAALTSPDGGRLLLAGQNQWVFLDAATGVEQGVQLTGRLSGDADYSAATGRLIKAHWDGAITFWDAAQGGIAHSIPPANPILLRFQTVRIHPDGQTCVVSPTSGPETETAIQYDPSTGMETGGFSFKGNFRYLGDGATGLFYPPSGEVPQGVIVDLATGEEIRRLAESGGGPSYMEGSPDGSKIAVSFGSDLVIYDSLTGLRLSDDLMPTRRDFAQPAFSPDGSQLIVIAESTEGGIATGGNRARQVSVNSGEEIRVYPPGDSIRGRLAAWSFDGRIIAYNRYVNHPALFTPSIVVADPRSGTLLAEIKGIHLNPTRLGFTDDSRELWIVTTYGEVLHYDLSDLIAIRTTAGPGNLLTLEWDETRPAGTYTLQEKASVGEGGWDPVNSAAGSHTIEIEPGQPSKFFRVIRSE